MAKKKEAKEESAENVPVTTAKPAGKAEKVAAAAGAPAEERPKTPSQKVPKLAKKNKSRLPRREKKALKKARQKAGEQK